MAALGARVRLLLAEDDALLGLATHQALVQMGHVVDWVTTGEQLLDATARTLYDCVLLDLGLAGLSGEASLRILRSKQSTVPVLVLTARAQMHERIEILDLGADDYLVKPFDIDEVAARVRALVRRGQGQQADAELVHGALRMRLPSRTLACGRAIVALTQKESLVLEMLMRQPERTHSRRAIEQLLAGQDAEIGSNTVEVHVHHLRRKLGSRAIATIRGQGYRIGPVDEFDALGKQAPGGQLAQALGSGR
jgi:DNA-binding response OmpR family regulator